MTVRVGHIEFLNCYPLYYGLQQRGALSGDRPVKRPGRPDVEFLPGVPTQLNRMLISGDIDFGPISSIAYARNHRRLLLSRHVSVSSSGAVESIQLVARRPLAEVRDVALTAQSATAVALLKTMMKLRYQQDTVFGELEGPVDAALRKHDAVLLIGDEALAVFHSGCSEYSCHDLGELWQDWTGLPMVYAVWAAREDFARANGLELTVVEQELVECADYGREHVSEVVDSAVGRFPFDHGALTRYFALLHYGFGPEYQAGLQRFYGLAYEAGELDEMPEFRFIDDYAADAMPVILDDTEPDAAPEPATGSGGSGTDARGAT